MGYTGTNFYEAGVFYCPYIELQTYREPLPKYMRRQMRRESLMCCPSAPHACTGDCGTPEHTKRIEEILEQEYGS